LLVAACKAATSNIIPRSLTGCIKYKKRLKARLTDLSPHANLKATPDAGKKDRDSSGILNSK
jgi:hypothetical protein